MLEHLSKDLNLPMNWQYFATTHGKGVVDGIGGAAKSIVRQNVMSKGKNIIVQDAAGFAQAAEKLLDKVQVIYISQKDIRQFIDQNSPWEDITDYPGILKIHSIKYCDGNISLYSTDADILVGDSATDVQHSFIVGDWVIINYDTNHYTGEVVDRMENDFKVNVMHRTFNGKFKWPENADCILYKSSSIVRKITPPVPVGNRNQFDFPDIDIY